MVFKSKLIFLGVIFTVCFYISIACAADIDIPLPEGSVKISERSMNVGPVKSFYEVYESPLSKDKVASFYKKEMSRAGWTAEKGRYFSKDNHLVSIIPGRSNKSAKKNRFTITTSTIPTSEELQATRKAEPDKLNFMPIYPGSEQLFLWDMPTGVSGSYETKSDIKEVVFFYKSGMLNYGWSLYNETPIKTGISDCPGCKQPISGTSNPVETFKKAVLVFTRAEGETCKITVSSIPAAKINPLGNNKLNEEDVALPPPPPLSSVTTIIVSYNAYKTIKL